MILFPTSLIDLIFFTIEYQFYNLQAYTHTQHIHAQTLTQIHNIHVHKYTHKHTHTHTQTHTQNTQEHSYTCTDKHFHSIYKCRHTQVYTCTNTYMQKCIHTYINTHIHKHTLTYLNIPTFTYIYILPLQQMLPFCLHCSHILRALVTITFLLHK